MGLCSQLDLPLLVVLIVVIDDHPVAGSLELMRAGGARVHDGKMPAILLGMEYRQPGIPLRVKAPGRDQWEFTGSCLFQIKAVDPQQQRHVRTTVTNRVPLSSCSSQLGCQRGLHCGKSSLTNPLDPAQTAVIRGTLQRLQRIDMEIIVYSLCQIGTGEALTVPGTVRDGYTVPGTARTAELDRILAHANISAYNGSIDISLPLSRQHLAAGFVVQADRRRFCRATACHRPESISWSVYRDTGYQSDPKFVRRYFDYGRPRSGWGSGYPNGGWFTT